MSDKERAEHLEELARAEEGRAMRMESDDLHDSLIAEVRREAESLRAGASALRVKEVLVGALEELADLMEAVRSGDYKPDTLTCQPARLALAEARKAP